MIYVAKCYKKYSIYELGDYITSAASPTKDIEKVYIFPNKPTSFFEE